MPVVQRVEKPVAVIMVDDPKSPFLGCTVRVRTEMPYGVFDDLDDEFDAGLTIARAFLDNLIEWDVQIEQDGTVIDVPASREGAREYLELPEVLELAKFWLEQFRAPLVTAAPTPPSNGQAIPTTSPPV